MKRRYFPVAFIYSKERLSPSTQNEIFTIFFPLNRELLKCQSLSIGVSGQHINTFLSTKEKLSQLTNSILHLTQTILSPQSGVVSIPSDIFRLGNFIYHNFQIFQKKKRSPKQELHSDTYMLSGMELVILIANIKCRLGWNSFFRFILGTLNFNAGENAIVQVS